MVTLIGSAVKVNGQDYRLWYRQPARNWNEALPVGNGRLGAMVFGGVETERLQLNEETVWTIGGRYEDKIDGHKAIPLIQELIFEGEYAEAERLCRDRILSDRHENSSTYQTLGDLLIRFEGLDEYSDYYRDLRFDRAVAETRFISGGATHSRRVFASAVDQALVFNGTGHTGWSRAWMINFYARLLQPEKAWQNLTDLWKQSTRSNLFNDHPPFQIDGNFGATAAIAEMLVQSHTGEINLLPCLPPELSDGEVSGLIARGGFETAMSWSNGTLDSVEIISLRDNPFIVGYGGKTIHLRLSVGEFIKLDGNLESDIQ